MRNNLSEFIKEKNMTAEIFAHKLGITKSFLDKIIIGNRNPSYNFLRRIKQRYPEIDIDKFFFEN